MNITKNSESQINEEYYLKAGNLLTTKIPNKTKSQTIIFLPEIALTINTIILQAQQKILKADEWDLKDINILLAPFTNGTGSKIIMKIILSEQLKQITKISDFYALTFEVAIKGTKTKNTTEFWIWYKINKNARQAQAIKIAKIKNFQFKIPYYPENRTIWMGALIKYFLKIKYKKNNELIV